MVIDGQGEVQFVSYAEFIVRFTPRFLESIVVVGGETSYVLLDSLILHF